MMGFRGRTMKIVIINGTNFKGITYHYARMLADELKGEVSEFFLPRDFGEFCLGCSTCLYKGEQFCPHFGKLEKITEAMDEADVLIFASPTFVYHVSGALKAFLDHYGYRWMLHRPNPSYFHKIGIAISTCAGAGAKSACKDIEDSLFFWGTGKIERLALTVKATSLSQITPATEKKCAAAVHHLAKETLKEKHPRLNAKSKAFFLLVRKIHQSDKTWEKLDLDYWKEKGWDKKNPW
jgi:multimeric flavodoxin WrbA